jgi:hypothetical protein
LKQGIAMSRFSRAAPWGVLAAFLVVSVVPPAEAGQSIVGKWAPDPSQCAPAQGMIGIGPLDMVGDEFRCDFSSVSRSGDVVTWTGSCGFPAPPEKATVVARLSGAVLHLRINGSDNGAYRRCR